MPISSQGEEQTFRTVYYIGNGARFIACTMLPAFSICFIAYLLSDSRQLVETLMTWRTNFVAGIVYLFGFVVSVLASSFCLWLPMRCFVFPSSRLGILNGISLRQSTRPQKRASLEIVVGGNSMRTAYNPQLYRALEAVKGTQIRVITGPRHLVVRVEAGC